MVADFPLKAQVAGICNSSLCAQRRREIRDTGSSPLDDQEFHRRLRRLFGRHCRYLGRDCRVIEVLVDSDAIILSCNDGLPPIQGKTQVGRIRCEHRHGCFTPLFNVQKSDKNISPTYQYRKPINRTRFHSRVIFPYPTVACPDGTSTAARPYTTLTASAPSSPRNRFSNSSVGRIRHSSPKRSTPLASAR